MAHGKGALTVVVRCSDPRLNCFFEEPALRRALGLGEADAGDSPVGGESGGPLEAVIANVGGLLSFAVDPQRLARDAGLLVSLFAQGRARVLLTAHSACGGYRSAAPPDAEESAIRDRQFADVQSLAAVLRAELPEADVEGYFLRLEDGGVERVEG